MVAELFLGLLMLFHHLYVNAFELGPVEVFDTVFELRFFIS